MKVLKKIAVFLLAIVAIVIVTAIIVLRRTDPEQKNMDAAARRGVGGSFLQLPGGTTHYELAGPDSGKIVVLVHGFSVPYYIWDSTFSALVNQGFRVLRYDEYGRGFSDRPDTVYTAQFLRRQLSGLLSALHINKVHALAGLSFGGPVVTDFAIHYPQMVQKLILIDPVYPDAGPGKRPWFESFEEYILAMYPERMVNGQLSDLKYPARFPHWSSQYKIQMRYKGLRHALVSTRFNYAEPDTIRAAYQRLNLLTKPVLLIWGREDQTVPFRYSDSLRRVLHTEFMAVDDAAHLPQMEKAGLVNNRLVTFLNMP
jgi:pimeloyl-ACP methyl ester carboxylesterase